MSPMKYPTPGGSRYRILRAALIGLTAVGLIAGFPVHAQGGETPARPNVVAQVYDSEHSYVSIFAPDGANLGKLAPDASARVEISPDARWLIMAGYDSNQGKERLSYSALDGSGMVDLPVEAGYSLLAADVTRDARFLTYTLAALDKPAWIIGLVEMATDKVVEVTGETGAASVFGADHVASVIDFDGKRVLVSAYIPFADGNFGGVYQFELPDFATLAAGRVPVPAAKQVVPRTARAITEISPDGTKLAILYDDPSNPPQNYQSLGIDFTLNTLAVLDLASSELRVVAQAGPGQVLEAMTWEAGSARIWFTGGNYQNTYYAVTPGLFNVEVTTGQVSLIAPLVSDPQEIVGAIRLCGANLYYDVTLTSGPQAVLYAIAPENPAARRSVVAGGSIALNLCAVAR